MKRGINYLVRHVVLLLVIILGKSSCIYAQNQIYRHMTTRDGLPSGYIWTMIQDSKGFIWIGTNAGLSRYDGYSFTNYKSQSEDPFSISGLYIRAIIELDSNTFLIGNDGGLDIFYPDEEHFKKVMVADTMPELKDVVEIEVMDDGQIWVAAEHGLYLLHKEDLDTQTAAAQYFTPDEDSLNGQPIRFNTLEYNGEKTLWIGSHNYLHQFDIGSKKFREIGPYDPEVEKILKGTIWSVQKASEGSLLISSSAGLARWRPGEPEPGAVTELGPYNQEELANASFQSITQDQNGNIWLGTGLMGAIRWDLENEKVDTFRSRPDSEQSINSDDVHYAFVDEQQNTWFGYHNLGISLMWSNTWQYDYSPAIGQYEAGEPENRIYDVEEDDRGNLWFATTGGLVYHPVNGEQAVIYRLEQNNGTENGFSSLLLSGNRIILTGLNNQTIYEFRKEGKQFRRIYHNDAIQLIPLAPVETDSLYYFSTFNGKLIVLADNGNETSEIEVPYDESIETNRIASLMRKDTEGRFLLVNAYLSSGSIQVGAMIFHPADRSFESIEFDTPLTSATIAPPHISRHQPGIFYTRVSNGIFRLNFETGNADLLFQSEAGVINEGTGQMYEDKEGYLWMSNQTGVMKLDPITESITNFETTRDLQPFQLSRPEQMNNGDILFMGQGGYIRFDPNILEEENPIQNIYISELMIEETRHETLYHHPSFEIESAENNLAFTFLGINYRDPVSTRYRYRIEGYNQDWNEVGSQRSIFLANLPPGRYAFQVQAAPRFGAYSDSTAGVSFTILPPWWRTLPAYVGYFLLLVGGVFTFDRMQRRRLVKKERERAREKELEQAREIEKAYNDLKTTQDQLIQAEKMASLGELTAGIAHEIQNPLNFINNFSEVNSEIIDEIKEELEKGNLEEIKMLTTDLTENEKKILYHGKRADSIVKGMLLHSRGRSGVKEPVNLNDLADEYLRLAYHGMRAKDKSFNAEFKTDLDDSIDTIEVVPQDIGRVLLNLISNAFYAVDTKAKKIRKVSPDSNDYKPEVVVSTRKNKESIEIRVRDNGEGIPSNIKDKIMQPFFTTKPTGDGTGLGLSMSYEIITKGHKGSLKVESEEDTGSEFIVELPQKK